MPDIQPKQESSMLDRKHGKLRVWGFLVGMELDDDKVTPDQVKLKLMEAATWVEGTGACDVEILGEIEIVKDPETAEVGIELKVENYEE